VIGYLIPEASVMPTIEESIKNLSLPAIRATNKPEVSVLHHQKTSFVYVERHSLMHSLFNVTPITGLGRGELSARKALVLFCV
jgi:hypothetical protein